MSALTEVFAAIAREVVAARDELNRLDAAAGDGDMGLTMATAAGAVTDLLPQLDGQDVASVLKRCGGEVARKAPSTSGTLLATALLRAGRAAAEAPTGSTAAQLAALVNAAQVGIQERGKAVVGDKTLLDALAPAAEALRLAATRGASVHEALADAASAASTGAEATRSMRPKVGRASWIADRSVGHEDAGAHFVALILTSAAKHVPG